MISKGSVTILLLLRRQMIAAAFLPVMLALMLGGCAPTVIPAGEKAAAPRLTNDRYVAADGTALALATWPAEGDRPKAVILGLHGFGDYRDAVEEPAEVWPKAGLVG